MTQRKRIQQKVRLSPLAHAKIQLAQRRLGLARFEDALGYLIDGLMFGKRAPLARQEKIVDAVNKGMDYRALP